MDQIHYLDDYRWLFYLYNMLIGFIVIIDIYIVMRTVFNI